MSEYGSGVSFTRACTMDKERIQHALNGKLICGEAEDGFKYKSADKSDCDEYVIDAYNNVVYHALTGQASGKALESLIIDEIGEERYKSADFMQEFMARYQKELNQIMTEYPFDEDKDNV